MYKAQRMLNQTLPGIDTNDQPPPSPLGVRDTLYCSQAVLSLYEGVPMLELIGEQTVVASALLRNMEITRRDVETARLDYLNTIELHPARNVPTTTRGCDTREDEEVGNNVPRRLPTDNTEVSYTCKRSDQEQSQTHGGVSEQRG